MKPISPDSDYSQSSECNNWKIFGHYAMNTQFAIRFPQIQANSRDLLIIAQACFEEIDRLENLFSRYLEDSEITQINQLNTGQSLILNDDTYQILKISFELSQQSEGFFDVTLGNYTLPQKLSQEPILLSPEPSFSIDLVRPVLSCLKKGCSLDLGAIGKGYALDCCREILLSLGIESALLSAGNSTYLTLGTEPWEVVLRGSADQQKIVLKEEALSASGTAIQGSHIINPQKPNQRNYFTENLWVKAKTATYADATSTLCMIAPREIILSLKAQEQYFTELYIEDPLHKKMVRSI